VVVTADQGVGIEANQSRRSVDPAHPTNLADLAFVPLFFKRPGQQTGAIVDRHVRTMDIVPTIADVLGIHIPWQVDGRSLFGPGHAEQVNFLTDRGLAQADAHALEQQRARTLDRKISLFGRGLLAFGPHPELLGRKFADLGFGRADADARVDGEIAKLLGSFHPGSGLVPAQVMGSITGRGAAPDRPVALALNGRIVATTRTYREGSKIRFSAMAAESALRPGSNSVALFWIAEAPRGAVLQSLTG
jgi:hypothetical protein